MSKDGGSCRLIPGRLMKGCTYLVYIDKKKGTCGNFLKKQYEKFVTCVGDFEVGKI